jgi:pimeloyl-ACP methyl ester carboxylesterase
MTLNRINAAGISALCRDGSSGRTIFFLHGIGGRAETFASLFAAWPTPARLIAWDAPGYGASTPLPHDWPTAGDYAARLSEALDGFGEIAPIDLVGHSLGCLVAGALATNQQHRVHKLVLIAPAPGYRVPVGGDLPVNVAARITELERLGPAAFAAARAGNLVSDPVARPDVAAVVQSAMAAVTVRGYGQAVRMLGNADLHKCAASITAPTLIINGDADRVTPLDGARRLLAHLQERPGNAVARLEIVPGAGHAVSIEQPEHVARLISEFLEAA